MNNPYMMNWGGQQQADSGYGQRQQQLGPYQGGQPQNGNVWNQATQQPSWGQQPMNDLPTSWNTSQTPGGGSMATPSWGQQMPHQPMGQMPHAQNAPMAPLAQRQQLQQQQYQQRIGEALKAPGAFVSNDSQGRQTVGWNNPMYYR